MYDDFAQYWSDVLDHVPFNPDYISIQNEPTFVTSGWTTCEWSSVETAALPSYMTAFDKVYTKISTRSTVPVMVGPESANIPAFISFANDLQSDTNCPMYALHPYDISSTTTPDVIVSSLQSVGSYSTKPNMITEFSDNLDWYNTALFIQRALIYANTSGYIYWKLTWNTPSSGTDAAMISISSPNSTATYTVTPYFYLIKHFAKNIDAGYHRVGASSSQATLITSAFMSPDNTKMTIIAVNDDVAARSVTFSVASKTATSASAVQSLSTGTGYYQSVSMTSPTQAINLPSKSITTIVLNF
jgi:O-glycosyl hydrolase